MTGESANKPSAYPSRGPRRRRALRVPIANISEATVLDGNESPVDQATGAPESSNVVELDPQNSLAAAVDFVQDRDPTEPMLMVEPDPLGGDDIEIEATDFSEPEIDVHFSDLPAPPDPPAEPELRFSEPPEELFLEDADVLSRSDIAPPPEQAAEMMIPIPKPPPPPADSADDRTPEVEEDENGPWYERFFGEAYLRTVRTATPKEVALECDFIERAVRVPVGALVI